MIAGALDHRDGAGIAHREALARDPAEIALALDRAVEHRIADDDRLLRHETTVGRRAHDDPPAREALADIVVGVALELERHPAREPGAEALARRAGEVHLDGVVAQPLVAVALGDLAREHRAGGAVGVADRGDDAHRRTAVEGALRAFDQLAVENVVDLVILRLALVDAHALAALRV